MASATLWFKRTSYTYAGTRRSLYKLPGTMSFYVRDTQVTTSGLFKPTTSANNIATRCRLLLTNSTCNVPFFYSPRPYNPCWWLQNFKIRYSRSSSLPFFLLFCQFLSSLNESQHYSGTYPLPRNTHTLTVPQKISVIVNAWTYYQPRRVVCKTINSKWIFLKSSYAC